VFKYGRALVFVRCCLACDVAVVFQPLRAVNISHIRFKALMSQTRLGKVGHRRITYLRRIRKVHGYSDILRSTSYCKKSTP
jgi:hypothetical protein